MALSSYGIYVAISVPYEDSVVVILVKVSWSLEALLALIATLVAPPEAPAMFSGAISWWLL